MKEKVKVPELRFPGFTDDWEERKLIDLATTYIGLVTTMTENYTNKGTLLIRNSDIKEGRFDLSNPIYLEEQFAEENKTRRMRKGDVVTVHTGDIGTSAMINNELEGAIGFATITTRPTKELDSNFLAWYFNSNYHKKYAKRMSTGDGRSNYNMKDFNKNVIPTPQIDEQQKIGAFFKQLDDTIALHQHKLDLLKEQKKGFLQKMFPKNGAKVPELRFAGFADDWEERKFKDILKTHSFRSYLADGSDDGKYEVIQQGNNPIVGYSDGEPFTDYKDITLFGDHTVSLYNPQSPFFIATDGVKILSADNFEGDYLYTTLERYKPAPQGYKRHFTILKNKDLCFTRNVEEQKQIGSFFKQLDNTITLHQRKLDLLKEQKKGFLQKMFV